MKTHVLLKFEYQDIDKKVLTSTVTFPEAIRDANYIEIVDFSPSVVLFLFTCDLITDCYSNYVDNLLSISLGGTRRKRYKAKVQGNIRELTVRMRYPKLDVISDGRQSHARAHLVIHSGLSINELATMKCTSFLLQLESDESQRRQSVVYKLPKPLFNARYIQVIDWFASGGYDYVICPLIKRQHGNDPNLSEPVLTYGVGGISKSTEVNLTLLGH